MGFSVSGASAIIFIGMFVSAGVLYAATSNGYERVSEARQAGDEQLLDRRNTDLNVTNTSYDATNGTLTVTVDNTGSTALTVNGTDLLVDNRYPTDDDYRRRAVEGSTATDLWLPGETLSLTVNASSPSRVKVVGDTGVAATGVV